MVTLRIEFSFYAKKPDGYTDYTDKKSVSESLILDTLAPYTHFPKAGHHGFKPPAGTTFGRWTSRSQYLGKEVSGKYYVTRIESFDEGRWKELGNPVGLFFDSISQDDPFLTLYYFDPTDTTPRSERRRGKTREQETSPYGYLGRLVSIFWLDR
jgi:hypothetical protein